MKTFGGRPRDPPKWPANERFLDVSQPEAALSSPIAAFEAEQLSVKTPP
jgi:hypothetical protein